VTLPASDLGGGTSCDLCGGTAWESVAEDDSDTCHLVLCQRCGLVQAAPRLGRKELDSFYDEEFVFDFGSRLNAGSGLPDPKRLENEERLAVQWAMPILDRFGGVEGRRVLDLRCRSCALTAEIVKRGAEVVGVEPFEGNINHARSVRGVAGISELSFSRFHELPLEELGLEPGAGFDVVNVLAHHVLAHVLSPRVLLMRIFECLKPGGLVLIDEKDVHFPYRCKTRSALHTGRAHQFHLTADTTEAYLRAAGFEVLECGIDRGRLTDFRHILAVARKPADLEKPPAWAAELAADASRVAGARKRLRTLERTWVLRSAFHGRRHKWTKRLRRLGLAG
jgi:SAM-dependent methyltransferase